MESAADAAATALGAWAWIRGYFTPATLFLVVNLVIGTIALTSRFATHHQRRRRRDHYPYHHHPQHQEPLHHHPQPQIEEEQPVYEGHYYNNHHPEHLYAPPPEPLARTSSVLDRLRSFGLYRFSSGDFPPEFGSAPPPPPHHASAPVVAAEEETMAATAAHYARSRSDPAPAAERRPAAAPLPRAKKPSGSSDVRKSQVARAVPSRTVEAVTAADEDYRAEAEPVVGGRVRRGPSPLQQQEYGYQHQAEEEEYVPPVRAAAPAPPLQRTSSVLDRLRSFGGLYGFLAPDEPAAVPASGGDGFRGTPAAADEKRHANAHAQYDRSRSEPKPEQGKKKEKEKKPEAKKSSARMAKSSSEAPRKKTTPAPRSVEAGGGECVNARAEAFIDSFRQQQQQPVQVHHYQEEEEYVPPRPPAPLSRTSSVLDRLRSFGLYGFRSGDAETDGKERQEEEAAAHYGRSRSEPAREQGKKKREQARMSKSSSSGGGGAEEAAAATEQCVDERADDFINKFRQQLQLQRLNSLLGGGGKQEPLAYES